jgi:hypothetical protein
VKTALRSITHKTGERLPLIFNIEPYQPLLTPLLWISLERRYKAYLTIDKDVRALKSFFDYCWVINFDLEFAILHSDFDLALANYDRFAYWIKSKKKTDKVLARMGNINSDSSDAFLGAETVNAYLGSVKIFLIWCINRYTTTP